MGAKQGTLRERQQKHPCRTGGGEGRRARGEGQKEEGEQPIADVGSAERFGSVLY